jgi:septum formation inhibitor-activating ATPase MinD
MFLIDIVIGLRKEDLLVKKERKVVFYEGVKEKGG